MCRYCFRLNVRPDLMAVYRHGHEIRGETAERRSRCRYNRWSDKESLCRIGAGAKGLGNKMLGLQRVCFQLQVKPGRIAEYKKRHAAVWPDMLRALADTGWHNYSLFLRADGLLIGYLETPSLAEAQAGMARTEVNDRWQAEMAEFFVDLGDASPDTGFLELEEVFHLEDQIAAND